MDGSHAVADHAPSVPQTMTRGTTFGALITTFQLMLPGLRPVLAPDSIRKVEVGRRTLPCSWAFPLALLMGVLRWHRFNLLSAAYSVFAFAWACLTHQCRCPTMLSRIRALLPLPTSRWRSRVLAQVLHCSGMSSPLADPLRRYP